MNDSSSSAAVFVDLTGTAAVAPSASTRKRSLHMASLDDDDDDDDDDCKKPAASFIDLVDDLDDDRKPAAIEDNRNKPAAAANNNEVIEICSSSDDEDNSPTWSSLLFDPLPLDNTMSSSSDNQLDNDDDNNNNFPSSSLAVAAAFAAASIPSPSNALLDQDDNNSSSFAASAKQQQQQVDDHVLAQALQNEEQDLFHKKMVEEEEKMHTSITGKAWKFVEKVQSTLTTLGSDGSGSSQQQQLQSVAIDDLVYLTERMLIAQKEFVADKKTTTHVDIGYHYTRTENLTRIRTDGLMSKQERDASNIIPSQFNGSAYGDGIYTAANPSAFNKQYGDIGLLVARLKGMEKDFPAKFNDDDGTSSINSIIVRRQTATEFVVLEKSYQCVPLVQFPSSLIIPFSDNSPGNQCVQNCHVMMQKLIDEFFNNGVPTITTTVVQQVSSSPTTNVQYYPGTNLLPLSTTTTAPPGPTTTTIQNAGPTLRIIKRQRVNQATNAQQLRGSMAQRNAVGNQVAISQREAPSIIHATIARHRWATTVRRKAVPIAHRPRSGLGQTAQGNTETIQYDAPQTLATPGTSCFWIIHCATYSVLSEECAICLDALSHHGRVARLRVCGHQFHQDCIEEALRNTAATCPTCRKVVDRPQGRMPSGTMTISRSPHTVCAGHEPAGSIVIRYNISACQQKEYHANPGQWHNSAVRATYLPDTEDGNKLLERLKFAFRHGLTFTVGTSLTTGQPNSVVWGSIHHKTSPHGGAHGYPDPGFIANCNKELDALQVPPADEL